MVDVTWKVFKKKAGSGKVSGFHFKNLSAAPTLAASLRRCRIASSHYANSGFDQRRAKGGFVVEQQRDGRSETESTSERRG